MRGQRVADARALIIGKHNRAVFALAAAVGELRQPGAEGDGPAGPERGKTGGRTVKRLTQIVMRAKERPRLRPDAGDVQLDVGPPPKRPPLKAVFRRPIDPVRIEPGLHILVTRDGEEALPPAADGLLQGMAADLGHGAIDHGRVFVTNGQRPFESQLAGQLRSKLLAGRALIRHRQAGGLGEADGRATA